MNFLHFPPEIRAMVYQSLFESAPRLLNVKQASFCPERKGSEPFKKATTPNILLACRTCYCEAKNLFYSNVEFLIPGACVKQALQGDPLAAFEAAFWSADVACRVRRVAYIGIYSIAPFLDRFEKVFPDLAFLTIICHPTQVLRLFYSESITSPLKPPPTQANWFVSQYFDDGGSIGDEGRHAVERLICTGPSSKRKVVLRMFRMMKTSDVLRPVLSIIDELHFDEWIIRSQIVDEKYKATAETKQSVYLLGEA